MNKFCKLALSLSGINLLILSAPVAAHHSFAIYDIDNKISRTGTLTKLEFVTPHITLELEAELEDGSTENWEIESMAPARWDSFGHNRDFAKVGDRVTILGWPARNGNDEMTLSTIIHEDGRTMVVLEEVRQRRAREDLPETTIKRD